MRLIELLYVSRATLAPGSERAQLDRILEVARVRNLALGVTGALVPIDDCFAQVLEGQVEAVNQLMVAILRDTRHADVRIVRVNDIAARRFPTWSMAELAPSAAASTLVAAIGRPDPDRPLGDAADALIEWMAQQAGSARLA